MGTQLVRHASRIVTADMEFTANGETTWSFTAECSGNIFDDSEQDNIASYTIDGNTETLPFAVENGVSYSIAITKTTTSATAYLKLKMRREEDETKTYNVPDFGSYTGRYIYALEDGTNNLLKFDSNLLVASNYEGSGVWTTTPLISTIVLPTLPTDYNWQSIGFVKTDDVAKIFVIGNKTYDNTVYGCFVYVDDDAVWNLEEDTADTYTTMNSSTTSYGISTCYFYDYINEVIYFRTDGQGTSGSIWNGYDLANKIYTTLYYTTNVTTETAGAHLNKYYYNPILERLTTEITDIDFINDRSKNKKLDSSNIGAIYNYESGYSYNTVTNSSRIDEINEYGARVNRYESGTTISNNHRMLLVKPDSGTDYILLLNNTTTVAIVQFQSANGVYESPLTDLATDQTTWIGGDMCASNLNGIAIAFGGNGDGTKRLYVFEPDFDGDTLTTRYLDLTNDLLALASNQLIA